MSRNPTPASLRRRAEKIAGKREPITSRLGPDDMANLVHEFEVYRIELELHNEALESIQEELQEQRDRYADLYDDAPVGYLTLDAGTSLVLDANQTACSMLGYERPALRRTRFTRYIEGRYGERFRRCLLRAIDARHEVCDCGYAVPMARPFGRLCRSEWCRKGTARVWR